MRNITRFVGDPAAMAAAPSGQTGSKRKYNRNLAPPNHIAADDQGSVVLKSVRHLITDHVQDLSDSR
jgi:hypothetical protein